MGEGAQTHASMWVETLLRATGVTVESPRNWISPAAAALGRSEYSITPRQHEIELLTPTTGVLVHTLHDLRTGHLITTVRCGAAALPLPGEALLLLRNLADDYGGVFLSRPSALTLDWRSPTVGAPRGHSMGTTMRHLGIDPPDFRRR